MVKYRKKTDLPVYSIDLFEANPANQINFSMGLMRRVNRDFSRISTPHRHDGYLITFITKGSGTHTIDSVTYDVKPYSVFLMIPGQVHSWSFSNDIDGFYIFFNLDFYSQYARERHLAKFPFSRSVVFQSYMQFDPKREAAMAEMLTEMYSEFTHKPMGWQDILRNYLDILIIRMGRYHKTSTVIRGSVTIAIQVRTLQALVDQHFRELKLPSEYAEKMKLSSRRLNMICKQATGKKATDFIHDRIIIEAKRQLAYSEKNLKQIALSLGYKDMSYFMRFFKKKTKQTPDQFRRSIEYVESLKPTYIS